MNFNDLIVRLKAHPGDPSITITSNAAHTYMDAGLVREHLKKLQREAEQVLLEHYDKRLVAPVIERTHDLISGIKKVSDLPGLALFVNKDVAEAVHLPFAVRERVTVGSSFFIRELLRTGLESLHYHVLKLSSGQAQLFEAVDAHLVGELRGDFPMENRHYTTDALKITDATGQDDQMRRFHQEVDHAVRAVVGAHGMVLVACVAEHYGHFLKSAERAEIYRGNLKGNFDHVPEREMIEQAWERMHEAQKLRNMQELERAADGSRGLFTTTADEIWTHVSGGRGHVLFLERDKHQAAALVNDHMVLVDARTDHSPGIDLVDAIIEEQLEHGGEVRILPNGSMEDYGGIALKMRY